MRLTNKRDWWLLGSAGILVALLFCLMGCCQPQVVGEKEMAGIIESDENLYGWLREYIREDPELSDAEKTIRLGEVEVVDGNQKEYLRLLKGDGDAGAGEADGSSD